MCAFKSYIYKLAGVWSPAEKAQRGTCAMAITWDRIQKDMDVVRNTDRHKAASFFGLILVFRIVSKSSNWLVYVRHFSSDWSFTPIICLSIVSINIGSIATFVARKSDSIGPFLSHAPDATPQDTRPALSPPWHFSLHLIFHSLFLVPLLTSSWPALELSPPSPHFLLPNPMKKHDKPAPFRQIAGVTVASPSYQRGETEAFNLSAGGNPPGPLHWSLQWTTKTPAINLQTSSCQRRRRLGI